MKPNLYIFRIQLVNWVSRSIVSPQIASGSNERAGGGEMSCKAQHCVLNNGASRASRILKSSVTILLKILVRCKLSSDQARSQGPGWQKKQLFCILGRKKRILHLGTRSEMFQFLCFLYFACFLCFWFFELLSSYSLQDCVDCFLRWSWGHSHFLV